MLNMSGIMVSVDTRRGGFESQLITGHSTWIAFGEAGELDYGTDHG